MSNNQLGMFFDILNAMVSAGLSEEVNVSSLLRHQDCESEMEFQTRLRQEDDEVREFQDLVDYHGPFCNLSKLQELIKKAEKSPAIAGTDLFIYLNALFDTRCCYDQTPKNDLR